MENKISRESLAAVADAITEKPIEIIVKEEVQKRRLFSRTKYGRISLLGIEAVSKDHKFTIYPPTMSKMIMIAQHCEGIKLDKTTFEDNPLQECFRICRDHIWDAVMIMAIATTDNSKKSTHDAKAIRKRAEFFRDICYPSDFAKVLMLIFSVIGVKGFMTSIGFLWMLMLKENTSENETGLIDTSADGRRGVAT